MGCCASKLPRDSNNGPRGLPREPPPPPPDPRPDLNGRRRVVALFDFDARNDDEITFRTNDELVILTETEPDWWEAYHEKTRTRGFVPSNYIQELKSTDNANLMQNLWYHGDITRQDASNLMRREEAGNFVVRDSKKEPGQLTLVIKGADDSRNLLNYKIQKTAEGKFCVSNLMVFDEVAQLIDYYRTHDGLKLRLREGVPRETEAGRERDQWEIDRATVNKTKLLGAGHFGEVYKGTWMVANGRTRTIAIKTLKPGTMSPQKFLSEATIMKDLTHPKIVKLLAIVTRGEPMMIITEYMEKGDLRNYLIGEEGQFVEEGDQRAIAYQIASGMAYLECKNFAHRDLAARNILMGRGNIAKIADFGLSKMLDDPQGIYQASEDAKFPIKWTAPESIEYLTFGIKADVWAYGITLHEIFTKGKVPYPGVANRELLDKLKNGYRMPRNDGVPTDVYKMMRECWDKDPVRRPTFASMEKSLEMYKGNTSE